MISFPLPDCLDPEVFLFERYKQTNCEHRPPDTPQHPCLVVKLAYLFPPLLMASLITAGFPDSGHGIDR